MTTKVKSTKSKDKLRASLQDKAIVMKVKEKNTTKHKIGSRPKKKNIFNVVDIVKEKSETDEDFHKLMTKEN